MMRRTEGVVRRDWTLRSWKSASCFRRKRFSAIKAMLGQRSKRRRASNSAFYIRLPARTEFLRGTGRLRRIVCETAVTWAFARSMLALGCK